MKDNESMLVYFTSIKLRLVILVCFSKGLYYNIEDYFFHFHFQKDYIVKG